MKSSDVRARDCTRMKLRDATHTCDVPVLREPRLRQTCVQARRKIDVLGIRMKHTAKLQHGEAERERERKRVKKTEFRILNERKKKKKPTATARVSALLLRSVYCASPPKRFVSFLSPVPLIPSLCRDPLTLSTQRPADYYTSAAITFPRRHPLS